MDIPRNYLSYPSVRRPPANTFFPEPRFRGAAFEIHGLGYRESMRAGMIDRPQGTGDWLFMYFHSPACMGVSDEAAPQPPGRMMVWAPGQRQIYGKTKGRYLHSWMHVAGKAVESLVRLHGIPQGVPFAPPAPRAFADFLAALHHELSQPAPDAIIAANLFENWLRDLGRGLTGEIKSAPPALRLVREHIDRAYSGPLTVSHLARMAGLSSAHFSTEFRRHFGLPPMEYALRRRLHHAAYLLHDVNLSVTEIGIAVGYDDLFHFSKLFKKAHGSAPRHFRQTLVSRSKPRGARQP
jgi:AraC-like DNA-binding protein